MINNNIAKQVFLCLLTTKLIIAQRISSVEDADLIIVLDEIGRAHV